MEHSGHTVLRRNIGDVRIMGGFFGPESHPCRAADCCRTKVFLRQSALLGKMFVYIREIVQGVHMPVLIVGQNEDDVRLFRLAGIDIPEKISKRDLLIESISKHALYKGD